MVTSEFSSGILLSAVEAAVIVTPKQRAVTERRREVVHHPPFERDNRLQDNFRANAGEALYAPKYRGKRFPDAVKNIAAGVGGDRLVKCQPPSGLTRHVQLENRLHGSRSLVSLTLLKKPVRYNH